MKNGPVTHLIATKLPEGKALFKTAGCSESRDRLLAFARTCGDCPAEIEAVTAESCELEWRDGAGKKLPWSESHRVGKWVILINAQ